MFYFLLSIVIKFFSLLCTIQVFSFVFGLGCILLFYLVLLVWLVVIFFCVHSRTILFFSLAISVLGDCATFFELLARMAFCHIGDL